MNKNPTILELRWSGKNPRIIYEDGINVLFYVNGDRHSNWAIWQAKEGLKDFYKLDWDRYHGNLWIPETDLGLCKWIQNVTIALVKNGVSKNNMYLATREIFGMKDDPTNEQTIDKIFEILKKYFGTIPKDFNKREPKYENNKLMDYGFDFTYRYIGISDLVYLFLTGYAFHYGNCIRYIPGDDIFNMYRSLKYRDMFYRASNLTNGDVNEKDCTNICDIYYRQNIESKNETLERIRNAVIASETGIEELITKNYITKDRINLTKDKKDKIIENIEKEILENKKDSRYSEKLFLFNDYDSSKIETNTETKEVKREAIKEKEM